MTQTRSAFRLALLLAMATALAACATGGPTAQTSPSTAASATEIASPVTPTASSTVFPGPPQHTPPSVTAASCTVGSRQTSSTAPIVIAVYDGPSADGSRHTVCVIGIDSASQPTAARVLASVTLASRAPMAFKCVGCLGPMDPPYVNTTKAHIYVLDGDATVRMLGLDGSMTQVTSVAGTAKARAAFAVSPDDSQIAVGVIDFSTSSNRLYVEKLGGGAHLDLFTTTTGPFTGRCGGEMERSSWRRGATARS